MRKATFSAHVLSAARQQGAEPEAMLHAVRSLGFDGLELSYGEVSPTLTARMTAAGLVPSGVYATYRPTQREETRRLLYDCASIGCRKLLLLPEEASTPAALEELVEGLQYTCEEAGAYGITVLLEDFDAAASPCCHAEDLRRLFDRVPALRWTFDTGNFIFSGQDTLAAFSLLKDRLSHLHLKDRRYEPLHPEDRPFPAMDGTPLYPSPAGQGVLPIAACVAAAASEGYDDFAVFEHFDAADQLAFLREDIKLKL